MRALVGGQEDELWDNSEGGVVFPHLVPGPEEYAAVLDFGCGCGRIARQLIQQDPPPERYLGIDLHRGMVRWCQRHLAKRANGFEFVHHDVWNPSLNPGSGKPRTAPFPAGDGEFTLVVALSVFTHLLQDQVDPYLREVARVLRPGGVAITTWFLFDKRDFPMLQEFQNALFVNVDDPTNAVIYDREWLRGRLAAAGLVPYGVRAPEIRGFQWSLLLAPSASGRREAEFPADEAPRGSKPPPVGPPRPDQVGVEG